MRALVLSLILCLSSSLLGTENEQRFKCPTLTNELIQEMCPKHKLFSREGKDHHKTGKSAKGKKFAYEIIEGETHYFMYRGFRCPKNRADIEITQPVTPQENYPTLYKPMSGGVEHLGVYGQALDFLHKKQKHPQQKHNTRFSMACSYKVRDNVSLPTIVFPEAIQAATEAVEQEKTQTDSTLKPVEDALVQIKALKTNFKTVSNVSPQKASDFPPRVDALLKLDQQVRETLKLTLALPESYTSYKKEIISRLLDEVVKLEREEIPPEEGVVPDLTHMSFLIELLIKRGSADAKNLQTYHPDLLQKVRDVADYYRQELTFGGLDKFKDRLNLRISDPFAQKLYRVSGYLGKASGDAMSKQMDLRSKSMHKSFEEKFNFPKDDDFRDFNEMEKKMEKMRQDAERRRQEMKERMRNRR